MSGTVDTPPIETLQIAWTAYLNTPLLKAILAYGEAANAVAKERAAVAVVTDADADADAVAVAVADAVKKVTDAVAVTTAVTDAMKAVTDASTAVTSAVSSLDSDSDSDSDSGSVSGSVSGSELAVAKVAPGSELAVVKLAKVASGVVSGVVATAVTNAAAAVKTVTVAVDAAVAAAKLKTDGSGSSPSSRAAVSSSSPAVTVMVLNNEVEKDAGLLKAWGAFIGTDLVIAIKKKKLEIDKEKKKAILTAAETAISTLKVENDVMKKPTLNATVVAAVNAAVDAVRAIISVLNSFFSVIGKDDKIKNLIDKANTEIDKVKVSSDSSSLYVDKIAVVPAEAKTTGEKTLVTTLYITSNGENFSVSEDTPPTAKSNVFTMNRGNNGCWTRVDASSLTSKAGGAMTKKRMRTTKRQLKGKRGLKSRVKSRVKTSRS